MSKKLRLINNKTCKKGFTLMEMLIVVAIIAILVVIAIPIFSQRLENARIAADQANERAAKAAATAMYYMGGTYEGVYNTMTVKPGAGLITPTYFDAATGTFRSDANKIKKYGQARRHDPNIFIAGDSSPSNGHVGAILKVYWDDKGNIELTWN